MISVWTTKHIPPQTGKRINCAGEQFTWTKNALYVEAKVKVTRRELIEPRTVVRPN
jgi:hypothetical protein